ncbi:MAG: FRG domain-containing protein [Candidatus Thiodiazotropha sp.]
MRFRDRRINKIGDLLKVLNDQISDDSIVWYRGQSDLSWQLVPGLGRPGVDPNAEMPLIKRFKQNAVPHITTKPSTEWEWLFLMQHHRLRTRLLDWTESPLAGLYFAVSGSPSEDAALWCVDPVSLNKNANISFSHSLEIPAFDHDEILKNYLPTTIASETTSDLPPIAAIASRNSPRIAAQLGTFTISHRNFSPIEDVGDKKHIWRIVIPADAKPQITNELRHLRYTRLTLFPELDSVADDAQELLP